MAGLSDVSHPYMGTDKIMHCRGILSLRKARRDCSSRCVRAEIVPKFRRESPCCRALRLDRALPVSVFGPVLRLAFNRFAVMLRFDAMPACTRVPLFFQTSLEVATTSTRG